MEEKLRKPCTEKKQVEEAMSQNEQYFWLKLENNLSPSRMAENLELADILDIPAIQSLMDDLYELTHITTALVDLKGNVLVIAGRQEICSKFHRVHPETCKHCIESDTKLSLGVAPGKFKMYRCKNNMWDVATPVVVEGQHVGNIFSGHFFFEDEPLEYELFRSQARKYGFNEEEYIAALDKVPRLSRQAVNKNMSFFMRLANMISQLSHSNFKLGQSLEERGTLVDALEKNKKDLDRAQAVGDIGSWRLDVCKNELTWSDENHRIFGIPKCTPLTYETFLSTVHPDDREYVDKKWKEGLKGELYDIEHRIVVDSKIKWVREKVYIEFDKDGTVIAGFGITQDITESKKSEEALRLSNTYNRSLIEASLDPLVTIGSDGKITDVNNSTEIITGYSREELLGTDFSNYFTEPEKAKEGYQYVFLKGLIRDYPLEIQHKDGHITPVLYNASVYREENGKVIGVFAAARDITEFKKAEEKIQVLANAVESSEDAIITKSLDGVITSWNKGAEKVYDYLAEEVMGKNISIIEPENLKGEVKLFSEKIKQGEKIQHYETLRLKKDGTIIDVSVTISPVFNASGELIAISIVARDITERKKAEEAIRLSNIYNRSLIEASLDPLVTIGPDGKITDVNEATELVTDYSRNELIGTDFSDYFTEPEKARTGYQQVFKDGEVRDYPLGIQHKDGHITPVLYNASVYRDENNKIIGVFAAARDITELKKAEESLKRAHDNLEKLVEERTSELEKSYKSLTESEKNLAEAQKISHIGSWDWNLITNEIWWSDEHFRIFGLNPQESAPASYNEFLNYVHPEDRDYVNNTIKEALNGKLFSIDHRIILPDGEEKVVHVQPEITFNEENNPVRIRGILQDITESKRTEKALRLSEERYRIVAEQTGQLVYEYNVIENTIDWAGNIQELTGFTPDEFRTASLRNMSLNFWMSRIHPEDKNWFFETYKKSLISEDTYRVEYRFRKKNGEYIFIEDNFVCQRNEKGYAYRIIGAAKNVTERKKAEIFLANIENARKREIHHRIKNNLQVISSLLDLEVEKFKSRERVEDLEVLEAFRESQDRIISIALIHEELHEGKGANELNFSPYLEKLVKNLFQTYSLRNINLNLDTDLEENIFFDIDIAVPLGLIVNEIISNSLKYAFSGRTNGTIKISLCKELYKDEDIEFLNDASGNIYRDYENKVANFILTVSDNGVGIPQNINIEDSDTLGFQLIAILVDQLEGKLELKRDSGTEFLIKFAIPGKE